ncbi:hypothetical protein CUMW_271830 [Citrus unshiu]|uniref:Polygalacturonase n=1 Tax=Citrus unshiu TaxID=55188 RepID=A0A2H5QXR4_CITUN|nr:hypothetical protein CUMW_271830 [Citrus unshiu]
MAFTFNHQVLSQFWTQKLGPVMIVYQLAQAPPIYGLRMSLVALAMVLGKEQQEAGVQNVTVTAVTFTGTKNGVRIKSWGRPSNGFARNILFQHALMNNVDNPIIIDQNYCPDNNNCPGQASGVKISDVIYQDIHGTSATEVGVKLDCSSKNPCTGISLEDVKLIYKNQPAEASCANADGSASGFILPNSCLKT